MAPERGPAAGKVTSPGARRFAGSNVGGASTGVASVGARSVDASTGAGVGSEQAPSASANVRSNGRVNMRVSMP
jgi:hypothetical protein